MSRDDILFPGLCADDTFRRTQSLADDLRRIAAGELPTEAELRAAPIIDHWSLAVRPESCVVGVISGHPSIGEMRPGRTSSIFVYAPNRWVRTWSRLYRLGVRAGEEWRQ